MPEFSVSPARYAKGKVAVQFPRSATGLKCRGQRLASGLGMRWSNREKAYITSEAKAKKLSTLLADGWDATFFGHLVSPRGGL